MRGGKVYPKPAKFSKELGHRDAKILPFEDPDSDRFENQLMFVPTNYSQTRDPKKNKTILFYNGLEGWWDIDGKFDRWMSEHKCPVDTCTFTKNHSDVEKADFILFSGQHNELKLNRTPNQIYAFYRLESPIHWPDRFPSEFNLTSLKIFKITFKAKNLSILLHEFTF